MYNINPVDPEPHFRTHTLHKVTIHGETARDLTGKTRYQATNWKVEAGQEWGRMDRVACSPPF